MKVGDKIWIYSLEISDTGRVYRDVQPQEVEVIGVCSYNENQPDRIMFKSGKTEYWRYNKKCFNTMEECVADRNRFILNQIDKFQSQWESTKRNLEKRIMK